MKNIRYVFSAYTCKTKISFFPFFPPPAASTKVFALWKNKFLTPYTCDLVEISFQYQTKKNREFYLRTHIDRTVPHVMHSYGGIVMCIWRDVLGHDCAHPVDESCNVLEERELWNLGLNEIILLKSAKWQIHLAHYSKTFVILTLSWILALHSARHWHRIQICCTGWRQWEITFRLIGGRRSGRRFPFRIRLLSFLLLRCGRIAAEFVDGVIFGGMLCRPRKSRWYFLLYVEKITDINFNERCNIEKLAELKGEHEIGCSVGRVDEKGKNLVTSDMK